MKLLRFHITGRSPGMLQNPATDDLLEALRTKTPAQKNTSITRQEDAAKKLYREEVAANSPAGTVGKMGVPMQNIMACVIIAGRQIKSGKSALSTAKDTRIYGFLEFVEEFCPFTGCNAEGNIPWYPFAVKGTMHVGSADTAVCINRPRISKWGLSFTVKFDDKQTVDLSTVVKLVEIAGRQIGLGDWRPAKRGRFGRFVVDKVEVLEAKVTEKPIEIIEYTGANEGKAPDDLKALATAMAAAA